MATPTIAEEIERRTPKATNILDEFVNGLRANEESHARITWPDPRYEADPVAFCRDILGFDPWSKQIELAEAIVRETSVACASGMKQGKSAILAALALWWFGSFPQARVCLVATKADQVQNVIYREIRRFWRRSGVCLSCRKAGVKTRPCPHSSKIDGMAHKSARSGIKSEDRDREIIGLAASTPENLSGISAAGEEGKPSPVLWLLDEASGIGDEISEIVEGSLAAGAKVVAISNPTRRHGFFAEAFHGRRAYWGHVMQISAEENPNYLAGEIVIPGLSTREYVRAKVDEHGRESQFVQTKVLGNFARIEEGLTFPSVLLDVAFSPQNFEKAPAHGRLTVGVDPAGEGVSADETAFAMRRGKKVFSLYAQRSLSTDGIVAHVVGLVSQHRLPREVPLVVVDSGGGIGHATVGALVNASRDGRDFEVRSVQPWANAIGRKAKSCVKVRDALHAVLRDFLKNGGVLPADTKLVKELSVVESNFDRADREFVSKKHELKSLIGRSPDRSDAVMLACFFDDETEAAREREYERMAAHAARETAANHGRLPHEVGVYDNATFNPYGEDR